MKPFFQVHNISHFRSLHLHLGSDYDLECTQAISDKGATFEGKIEWNGDWVLNFMVPLDLSGPETQGLHSSLKTKTSHFIHVWP